MQELPLTITIIGAGRLGRALAIALSRLSDLYKVENLVVRNYFDKSHFPDFADGKAPRILRSDELSKIRSEIVLITTQDSQIQKVSEELARQISHDPIVLHCSGALSSQILSPHAHSGSMHPLISISSPQRGAESFSGSYFCIEGERKACESAETIVRNLGGRPFSIETEFKPLYHASAVMASGHVVALLSTAFESLAKCGIDSGEAKKILFPLINSTISNLEELDPPTALTGTFARLDESTFENHVRSLLENLPDEIVDIYLQLGLRSLHLVEETESNSESIERMREKISLAKRNLKC